MTHLKRWVLCYHENMNKVFLFLIFFIVPVSVQAQVSIDFGNCRFTDGPFEEGIALQEGLKLCAYYTSCGPFGGNKSEVPTGWQKYQIDCHDETKSKPQGYSKCPANLKYGVENYDDIKTCCEAMGYKYTELQSVECQEEEYSLTAYVEKRGPWIMSSALGIIWLLIISILKLLIYFRNRRPDTTIEQRSKRRQILIITGSILFIVFACLALLFISFV